MSGGRGQRAGVRLGADDPLDRLDDVALDPVVEAADVDRQAGLVGDDVGLRAGVELADGHHGRLACGSISRATIVCRRVTMYEPTTTGSIVVSGRDP